ncbi:MAG: 1-deoxy-D-xylulose-5-phosphate synthase, partial [Alistipes sp.]|nr:1-deoxy-D-xylulose-5-phosphate synthase [Alistipes sp.]
MKGKEYKYLYGVDSPGDLKALELDELPAYCDEVRRFIVESLARAPGHLASSLGAVELTVALHYVFDTPGDKIVWDVGHQAYAHKIITGRRDEFGTLRKQGGIAGFPRPGESVYDPFIAGHSSTSISAALGFSTANRLAGRDEHVVAVIGDGAMTGGLAFEGLNNAGVSKSDLLVVLNDNRISIDKSTGGLADYLVGITTSPRYNRLKTRLWNMFPPGSPLHNAFKKTSNAIKHGLLQQSNLFESFGFRYFGPVDGHDVVSLVKVLRDLRHIGGPKLLHTMTVKGRGYAPAELDQPTWHAPGKFDAETGVREADLSAKKGDTPTSERGSDETVLRSQNRRRRSGWQDVFGETLVELARADERIVGITPAMPTGSSLCLMMGAEDLSARAFDVGIAEGHAVTFSAGLAAAGMVPFCTVYSSFLQRAYDNVIH